MTNNQFHRKRLVFDLETIANPDTLKYAPEPEAPGNLKDPEKIAKAIEEKRQDQIDRAPLDPDYGEIITIGYATDPLSDVVVLHGDEKENLKAFWHAFQECSGYCIGYNIIGFDLPYIMRRSMAHNIKPAYLPNLAKYRTEPVTDLMGILYNWGPAKGLKQVAKIYQLPVECPGVDGSQVGSLPIEKIIEYQVSDVKLTISLWQRMNGVYFNH
jgi:DNA polymerase elongation subunit (family B)